MSVCEVVSLILWFLIPNVIPNVTPNVTPNVRSDVRDNVRSDVRSNGMDDSLKRPVYGRSGDSTLGC